MTTSELKTKFQKELEYQYSVAEINILYSIFVEKFLGWDSFFLKIHPDQIFTSEKESSIIKALDELKNGMPYQQILGEAEFFGYKFNINQHVLIPRPETEELIELAINIIKKSALNDSVFRIIDIGTGSGIIPIILKKKFPKAEVFAMDISAEALMVAQSNATQHKVEINFIHQDFLNKSLTENYDVIISNPPYIGKNEILEIENSVKDFEPLMALFSPTDDALVFYKKIAEQAKNHLNNPGFIFLEINQKLGQETLNLYNQSFSKAELIKDISGNDRMISVFS